MSFHWENGRSIADLYDPDPLDRLGHRIIDRAGDFLKDRVRHHTPVADPPPGVAMAEWVEERGGRPPATLKESWVKGEIEILATDHLRVTVETFDPVAPYVEYPTRPHLIRAKPGGMLRFRDRETGETIFATEVHHPGTEGSYMMHKAIMELIVELPFIMREELGRWELEQVAA